MTTLPPGPPCEISLNGTHLDFIPPEYDGGGRIIEYQVNFPHFEKAFLFCQNIFPVSIFYFIRIHALIHPRFTWWMLTRLVYGEDTVLSQWNICQTSLLSHQQYLMDFEVNLVINTQHISRNNQCTGRYIMRVVARNMAGVGQGNTVLVDLEDVEGKC